MKRIEMRLAVVLLLGALVAGCSGGSSGTAQTDPVGSVEPTATSTPDVVAETPTAEPAVSVGDDELVAAALASYEATPEPAGTIAWDVLASSITADLVSFTMCTWDGESAFDQVRDVRYRVSADPDGAITATNVQASPTSGDCLNTTLISTAIDAINTHDAYWSQVLLDPASFADDPRGQDIFTENARSDLLSLTEQWVEDDVYFKATQFDGVGDDIIQAPLALRRYSDLDRPPRLELAICRNMHPEYGLYRGSILLDDFKDGTIDGPHSIGLYAIVADASAGGQWKVDEVRGLGWGDCFNTGSWLEVVGTWQPEPVEWALLDG